MMNGCSRLSHINSSASERSTAQPPATRRPACDKMTNHQQLERPTLPRVPQAWQAWKNNENDTAPHDLRHPRRHQAPSQDQRPQPTNATNSRPTADQPRPTPETVDAGCVHNRSTWTRPKPTNSRPTADQQPTNPVQHYKPWALSVSTTEKTRPKPTNATNNRPTADQPGPYPRPERG